MYFIAEYRRNVIDNPRFIEKLSQIVQYVKKNVDEVRKEQIQTDKENGYKDFGGVIDKGTRNTINIDFRLKD